MVKLQKELSPYFLHMLETKLRRHRNGRTLSFLVPNDELDMVDQVCEQYSLKEFHRSSSLHKGCTRIFVEEI